MKLIVITFWEIALQISFREPVALQQISERRCCSGSMEEDSFSVFSDLWLNLPPLVLCVWWLFFLFTGRWLCCCCCLKKKKNAAHSVSAGTLGVESSPLLPDTPDGPATPTLSFLVLKGETGLWENGIWPLGSEGTSLPKGKNEDRWLPYRSSGKFPLTVECSSFCQHQLEVSRYTCKPIGRVCVCVCLLGVVKLAGYWEEAEWLPLAPWRCRKILIDAVYCCQRSDSSLLEKGHEWHPTNHFYVVADVKVK